MKRNSTKPPKPLPPTRIVLHGSNVYCFLAIQASSAGRAPHCWCAIQTLRVTFQHGRAKQEARSYRGITLPRGLCGSQRGAARIWTPPPRGRNTGTTNTRFWDNSGNSGAMAIRCKDMCLIDKRQWELLEGYAKERHLLGGWSSPEGLECCLRRCPARVIPTAGGRGISNLIW